MSMEGTGIYDPQDGFTAGYEAWLDPEVLEPPHDQSAVFYAYWAEGYQAALDDAREEQR